MNNKEKIEEVKNKFQQIKELLEDDLDLALSQLDKIDLANLSKELKNDYYYLAGDIHYARDEFDDAITCYKVALKNKNLDKENIAKIYANLASLYFDKESYKDAINYANRAIRLSSDHQILSKVLDCLALSYQNLGNYQRSIDYLLRILELYGEERNDSWSKYFIENTYASLSFAYWKANKEERSEYYFQKLISLKDPNQHELKRAYLCKAHRLYEKREWKDALDYYDKAITLMDSEEDKQFYQKYINDCKGWLAKEKK